MKVYIFEFQLLIVKHSNLRHQSLISKSTFSNHKEAYSISIKCVKHLISLQWRSNVKDKMIDAQ